MLRAHGRPGRDGSRSGVVTARRASGGTKGGTMVYRPCKFRSSQLGIFQCEKHRFMHTAQEHYQELYEFLLERPGPVLHLRGLRVQHGRGEAEDFHRLARIPTSRALWSASGSALRVATTSTRKATPWAKGRVYGAGLWSGPAAGGGAWNVNASGLPWWVCQVSPRLMLRTA